MRMGQYKTDSTNPVKILQGLSKEYLFLSTFRVKIAMSRYILTEVGG